LNRVDVAWSDRRPGSRYATEADQITASVPRSDDRDDPANDDRDGDCREEQVALNEPAGLRPGGVAAVGLAVGTGLALA
jgi:hypothetical protein